MTERRNPEHLGSYLAVAMGRLTADNRGLVLPPDMTKAEFASWLTAFLRVRRLTPWAIGDLLLEAEKRWGDEALQEIDLPDVEIGTAMNYLYLARRFPPDKRRTLPWGYHADVAYLEDRPAAEALLAEVEKAPVSREEFREKVRELRHATTKRLTRVKEALRNAVGKAQALAELVEGLTIEEREQIAGPLAELLSIIRGMA